MNFFFLHFSMETVDTSTASVLLKCHSETKKEKKYIKVTFELLMQLLIAETNKWNGYDIEKKKTIGK